jgi:hypothetical protein
MQKKTLKIKTSKQVIPSSAPQVPCSSIIW